MRFVQFSEGTQHGLAVENNGVLHGMTADEPGYPGSLQQLLAKGTEVLQAAHRVLSSSRQIERAAIRLLPPLSRPSKIVCVGLNYADHTKESPYEQPDYPTFFPRFASTLIGCDEAIIRPNASEQLDYEGELAVIIGKGGRHISRANALEHVAGYSIFNEASIRDYQFKSPQWTIGKNFDATGAFGPVFVSADELPAGAKGLGLITRLNGEIVQQGNTADMIFDVAELISVLSEALTLEPGDLIVSGTPAGIGWARKPPLFMKPGDLCTVEIEGIGTLSNPIADEASRG
ncbi:MULTISPECIES: fumarylacetoacetate hydrolase family protein [Pseudomonas]|uniref:Fumarylacetoacetate hydrolase family protein n=1 Tax=Pseudomonas sp. Hg7Tf TaxID=3236988 RepID=A0AB39I072_9PSED|nr:MULTISPECIES: fumarylacetoacetate hydrolase family protein [Pseudomonas]KJK08599.1 5-oxopent-3-ene-1,2,5-tricarboxylate decarboxylase [Pseudomonas sp. 5]MDD1977790.1 fumarylacetoacetate hydrolase family protein [Pseudomonas putida]MDH2561209.1 fumarylacetoacetate hydrolase family protein [Pseudomonas sp. Hg5Tf]